MQFAPAIAIWLCDGMVNLTTSSCRSYAQGLQVPYQRRVLCKSLNQKISLRQRAGCPYLVDRRCPHAGTGEHWLAFNSLPQMLRALIRVTAIEDDARLRVGFSAGQRRTLDRHVLSPGWKGGDEGRNRNRFGTHSSPSWLGWTLYSFLESRETGKQNVREHFPLSSSTLTRREE